jgi:ubiquinone/menaquinone biosynthesis C-methylase UbiE
MEAARRVGPRGHVIGVDLSGGILREAERVVHGAGLENVELRKMDAEHLEFPDQAFDAVTCAFGLFLFPNMNAALHEMYRVSKPDGCLAVTYFHRTPTPFDPGIPILMKQFSDYRIGLRLPQALACTTPEIEALLNEIGFRSIGTFTETNDIVYRRIEDWWEFVLTLMPRGPIMGMSEERRARFRDEYLEKLRPQVREDGLHISLGVVYALAKR